MTFKRFRPAALLASLTLGAALLVGCAAPQITDYAAEKPTLDMRQYFNGTLDAYGIFTNRAGKVVRRFTVVITCKWVGDTGTLDEDFSYSDGTKSRRIWTLVRTADGKYTGTAADVIGTAQGEEKGNAFRWGYTLDLPVDGKNVEVQLDDWMYLMTDKVMLNRAVMSKYGIKVGEITLSFAKR